MLGVVWTRHSQQEPHRHHRPASFDGWMNSKEQCPQKQRAGDEIFVAHALRDPSTGPESDQVSRVEEDEQPVVFILGHRDIFEDPHGTGRGERRFVEMDQEGNPPCLDQEIPEILANDFTLQLRGQRTHVILVLVIENRGIIGIFLVEHTLTMRRSTRGIALVMAGIDRTGDITSLLPRHDVRTDSQAD